MSGGRGSLAISGFVQQSRSDGYGFTYATYDFYSGGFNAYTPDFLHECEYGYGDCTDETVFQSFIVGYDDGYKSTTYYVSISSIPVPPSILMGLTSLAAVVGLARRKRRKH